MDKRLDTEAAGEAPIHEVLRARRSTARIRESHDVVWDLGSDDFVCSGAPVFLGARAAADRDPNRGER